MPGLTRSRTVSAFAASLALICLSVAADAKIRFDLPAQPLTVALTTVGNLANLNILFDSTLVDGLLAPPLKAELSADDALALLLAGTRLRALRVNGNTVSVVTEAEAQRAESVRNPNTSAVHAPGITSLAYAGSGSGAADRDPVDQGSEKSSPNQIDNNRERKNKADYNNRQQAGDLEEVLVSAQKRTERLQDVPVPVTAISAGTLVDSNQLRLQDYYTRIPGVTVTLGGDDGASPLVVIRGVTTGGFNNPTVGVTV
ncbi:MAG: TonB-dependent receptor, plug, partial [Gammaproteobacteria bacterium]|nr:TonB-dependent receptor, plug [Gammaproteobacteria bacterium]